MMKHRYRTRIIKWSFWISLSLVLVAIFPYVGLSQGEVCNRSDFVYLDGIDPTAPTPIKSTQPQLSVVNTAFDDRAGFYGISTWVMKAIANKESGWRQIDTLYPNYPVSSGCNGGVDGTVYDCGCVSPSLDYGIMQLNWGSNKDKGWDWNKVMTDYIYNIARGAEVLVGKSPDLVNDGDLGVTSEPINWYLKLWAYNSYGLINNPSTRPRYNPDRNWNGNERLKCDDWPKVITDSSNNSITLRYPYQEQVLYLAQCQSNQSGLSWPTIGDFPIPDDDLFTGSNAPSHNILIFDAEAINSACPNQPARIDYSISQYAITSITIRDGKPWDGGTLIKTLPAFTNHWDGTNNTGQAVADGEYWFSVEVKNSGGQLIGLQSGLVEAGGACGRISYLPLIQKGNDPPPADPTCTEDILVFDEFEGGDPFSGGGTSTAGPWQRKKLDGFPEEPMRVSIDHHNNPVPRPPGDDGLRVGGADNETFGLDRFDIDQKIYIPFSLPPGATQVKVSFDVLLISDQNPANLGAYDHLYWGLQTTDPDTTPLSHFDKNYDCNEDTALAHDRCWNNRWLLPTEIIVDFDQPVPTLLANAEGGNMYSVFEVDVSHVDDSYFFIDNFKLEVTQCN